MNEETRQYDVFICVLIFRVELISCGKYLGSQNSHTINSAYAREWNLPILLRALFGFCVLVAFYFFSLIAAEHCNIRMMDKQLNSNTGGFKSKVVEFSLEHGKCGAGIKFDVDWKCVWGWCNQRMHSGTKAAKSALSEASHGSFLNWNWKKSSHAMW